MVPAPIKVGLDDYSNAHKVWWTIGATEAPSPPPEHFQEAFFDGHDISAHPVSPQDSPLVVVVGMGELGLRLATAFGKHYDTFAYDISKERLAAVQDDLLQLPNVVTTTDTTCFTDATHFIVAVPTCTSTDGHLDTYAIRTAVSTIALYARPGSTIIIEGSIGVGMTRKLLEDLVADKSLKAGFSPSQTNVSQQTTTFLSTPKLISALDPEALSTIHTLYAPVFSSLNPVSSPEVAELTSLYCAAQATICAAYASEMAAACAVHAIDPTEVTKAASSKPFGFLPTSVPAMGYAGDEHTAQATAHLLATAGAEFPLLNKAARALSERPKACADRAMRLLLAATRRRASWTLQTRGPRVLVVGVGASTAPNDGSKPSLLTPSTSPGLAIASRLRSRWDVDVEFADPRVSLEDLSPSTSNVDELAKFDDENKWHTMGLSWFDLIIVAQDADTLRLEGEVLGRLSRTLVVDFS